MKVCVLGGGGYLGCVLVDLLLQEGHRVVVYDNLYRKSNYLISKCGNPNFEFVYGDILDQDRLIKVVADAHKVVLLAALVGEPICARLPQLASLVNVEGTYIVTRCVPKDVPILFASTGSCYGAVKDLCTEETPLNGLSHYAQTKISGEQLVSKRSNTIIYRFSTAFGISGNMRTNLLVNTLVRDAKTNGSLTIFQKDFRRSFIHTKDIAKAILFGLNHSESMGGQIFNVGDGEGNWSKFDLAEYIKSKTNCFVSYADSGYIDTDKRDYEISFDKINNLGWYAETSIEEGVDELLRASDLIRITHEYE